MKDERIVEVMAEAVDQFMVHPLEAHAAGEAVLAALRDAGFDVVRRCICEPKPQHSVACRFQTRVPVGGDS